MDETRLLYNYPLLLLKVHGSALPSLPREIMLTQLEQKPCFKHGCPDAANTAPILSTDSLQSHKSAGVLSPSASEGKGHSRGGTVTVHHHPVLVLLARDAAAFLHLLHFMFFAALLLQYLREEI